MFEAKMLKAHIQFQKEKKKNWGVVLADKYPLACTIF